MITSHSRLLYHISYMCCKSITTTHTTADVSLSLLGAPRHAMKMADIVSTAVREAEIYNNHKIVRLPSANLVPLIIIVFMDIFVQRCSRINCV